MLYDVLYNYCYMPLHHPRKIKIKKRNIKSRKIDKKKIKMFKSKYTITQSSGVSLGKNMEFGRWKVLTIKE